MSGRMNRAAYEKLIEEDVAWLNSLPRTLERDHIIDIVKASPENEYNGRHELARKVEELERLISDRPSRSMYGPEENREALDIFQRLWEACVSLVEKAQFKFVFRYAERIETELSVAVDALRFYEDVGNAYYARYGHTDLATGSGEDKTNPAKVALSFGKLKVKMCPSCKKKPVVSLDRCHECFVKERRTT